MDIQTCILSSTKQKNVWINSIILESLYVIETRHREQPTQNENKPAHYE